jgi:hypothetical protein
MIRKLILLATLCVVTVMATNVRPVTVNSPPLGEQSLQQILDSIYGCTGCVSAANDQSTAAYWQLIGVPPQVAAPIIKAVNAAAGNAIGIYTDPATPVLIFTATSHVNSAASITFFNGNQIQIMDTTLLGGGCVADGINCGIFTGINQSDFGFVLETNNAGGHTYFTDDSLNPGPDQARALAYQYGPADRWALAFEDGTDFDYNDKVMSIESITAIPEPASVVLFGTLLVLCGSGLRRRRLS